jgi:sulfur-carrier protein
MITINIAGFLTDFTDGRSQINLDGSPATVGEALTQLWERHAALRDRVVNEQGHVRPHVNVFLNAENVRRKEALDTPVSGDAEITILPAVSGGSSKMIRNRGTLL